MQQQDPRASVQAAPQASLLYKLLLLWVALVATWLLFGLIVPRLPLSPAWREPLGLLLPLLVSIGVGWVALRQLQARIEVLMEAIERLARGEFATPIAVPERRLTDEVDLLLARLEAVRSYVVDLLGQAERTVERLHQSSVAVGRTAQSLYSEISSFSHTLDNLARGAERQSEAARAMQAGMQAMVAEAENHRALATDAEETSARMRAGALAGTRTIEDALRQWEIDLSTLGEVQRELEAFEETARKIGTIVEVIVEVARKTNVLGLNAGLEAARAGEEGEAFLVLAEEIRTLSEETFRRADTIESILAAFGEQHRRLLERLRSALQMLATSAGNVGTVRLQLQEMVEGLEAVIAKIAALSRAYVALGEQIGRMYARAEEVMEISEHHARVTRESVGETRDQMVVDADELLREARKLDQQARQLAAHLRQDGGGA